MSSATGYLRPLTHGATGRLTTFGRDTTDLVIVTDEGTVHSTATLTGTGRIHDPHAFPYGTVTPDPAGAVAGELAGGRYALTAGTRSRVRAGSRLLIGAGYAAPGRGAGTRTIRPAGEDHASSAGTATVTPAGTET